MRRAPVLVGEADEGAVRRDRADPEDRIRAGCRDRTDDLPLTRRLLYRLS
jgi:hypothetical protein